VLLEEVVGVHDFHAVTAQVLLTHATHLLAVRGVTQLLPVLDGLHATLTTLDETEIGAGLVHCYSLLLLR
jgi:hypothetical protein